MRRKRQQIHVPVSVVTPTIPPRAACLKRAVQSVADQTYLPMEHIVTIDHKGKGAAATRNKAIKLVRYDWTFFLDDDDTFYPQHVEKLLNLALDVEADVVYPMCDFSTPFRGLDITFGHPFNPELLMFGHTIPISILVRTELLREVGGYPRMGTREWPDIAGEDLALCQRLYKAGGKLVHLPEVTWTYHNHKDTLEGRPWTDHKDIAGKYV